MTPDSTDPELLHRMRLALDAMNTKYEDAMLLVGRVFGDRLGATGVRALAVDSKGLDLMVTDPAGDHPVRAQFANPISDWGRLITEVQTLVSRARELSGEAGETTIERGIRRRSRNLGTYLTNVSAVEPVHPHLQKITFQGGDLESFGPPGPHTYLRFLIPPPGRSLLSMYRSFSLRALSEMPEKDRPSGAFYSIRSWRPEVAEIDMLFVLHEPAGPTSAWAASANPGDQAVLWGPSEDFEPPPGVDWYLLVADDTGLPGVGAILESIPADTPAIVVGEVDSAVEQQPLPAREGIQAVWVYRNGASPGTVPEALVNAVRALDLPSGKGHVWGGGESHAVTAVRRYIREEVGLPREQVQLIPYWRYEGS